MFIKINDSYINMSTVVTLSPYVTTYKQNEADTIKYSFGLNVNGMRYEVFSHTGNISAELHQEYCNKLNAIVAQLVIATKEPVSTLTYKEDTAKEKVDDTAKKKESKTRTKKSAK